VSWPSGVFSLWGPFWALPNEFLTGFSAAAGIALINCFGNLGGFVGPYAIGAISKKTGNLQAGLVFVGISLFRSAMLILALRKRSALETGAVAMAQSSPAVMPTCLGNLQCHKFRTI
jgi:ACS family tartrate transporter-like MFS transporter